MFSNTVKSVIKKEVGVPNINNFVVPEINPQILNSDKVQANKNILEGDNRVGNIQEFILSASFPLLKLWQSIISSDEDLEAEEVLDRVQQSLFCMGSAFAGLNLHRKKRFKSVLTKEFSAIADEEGKSSELSGYLFGEDLSEKIKEQLESNRITRRVVVGEDKTKSKSANAAHRKPFSGEGKGWSEDLLTEEGARKGQHSASQCRPKLQPNHRRNFSKDSNLYRQMDQVNRRSRDFRYCIRLSTGFFRDSSSAKTTNSIQPFRRGGEVGGLGGGETSEEGGYRGV